MRDELSRHSGAIPALKGWMERPYHFSCKYASTKLNSLSVKFHGISNIDSNLAKEKTITEKGGVGRWMKLFPKIWKDKVQRKVSAMRKARRRSLYTKENMRNKSSWENSVFAYCLWVCNTFVNLSIQGSIHAHYWLLNWVCYTLSL